MSYWLNKRVTITGGAGFLGRHVVDTFRAAGAEVFAPGSRDYDLRDRAAVTRLMEDSRPEVLVHLAARVGGIGSHLKFPGKFFYENAVMGLETMEAARVSGVRKFVGVGTICSYPKITPIPFKEESLWDGYPEEATSYYGLAKKMMIVQAQAYRKEYGYNAICLMPVNLYGPGDNFDPEASHVMAALIRKFVQATEENRPEVVVWGTGNASREFMHVKDAADAILLASERYDKPDPVNMGSGREVRIRELADLLKSITGFSGRIIWDTSKPDGQPRRCLDVSKAEREFGFRARVPLEEGVRDLVEWYKRTRPSPGVSAVRR